MARKGTTLLGTVSVGLIALFASGGNCYYRTNGSGTWEDASRWDGGKVPQSGDVVCITNGTARATAADISVLTRIYAITLLRTNDVIEFDLDVDYHHPTRIIGKGFSKLYLTTGGIEVNGGELHLVEVDTTDKNPFTYGPLTVNAPGKLFLRPGGASYTPGISGDGVITNTSTGGEGAVHHHQRHHRGRDGVCVFRHLVAQRLAYVQRRRTAGHACGQPIRPDRSCRIRNNRREEVRQCQ